MQSTTPSEPSAGGLTKSLTRIAADPEQTCRLHGILGDFCHQARNLLNCLKMSLYLTRRGSEPESQGVWNEVETSYQDVERLLERIQLICRPLALNPVRLSLSLLFEDRKAPWEDSLSAAGRSLILESPNEPNVGAYDPVRFGLGFDDLVAWRAREGTPGTDLRVRWSVVGSEFQVVWDEPERAPAEQPGERPASATNDLTVPLLTRIVTLHGGRLDEARGGRWRLDLRWPLDSKVHQEEAPRC